MKGGHSLTMYNRSRQRAEGLRSAGAQVADTPGPAVLGAEALITMLADDQAVEDVLFSAGGAIPALLPGAVHISMSTINAAIYRNYGSMIAAGVFEPVGFKMPLGLKDNRLLLAAAEAAEVPMPMASLMRDRFLAALAQGMSEADWAAIARLSLRNAGL
jgi:3-hydroxyisobutyrate dehydrogenase-like beta-hydroxyacid dehydrogenase